MRIQGTASVLSTAAVTMALALGYSAMSVQEAGGEAEESAVAITPSIQTELEVSGLNLSFAMDKEAYSPGETPVVQVTAVNPTDQPIAANVWIGMTSQSMASLYARSFTIPEPVWSYDLALEMDAGASKTFTLATEQELTEGAVVSLAAQDAKERQTLTSVLNRSDRVNGQAGSIARNGVDLATNAIVETNVQIVAPEALE